MNILVTGGTGFIGKALVQQLIGLGATCYIVTRSPKKSIDPSIHYITWEAIKNLSFTTSIDAIYNLAGESINNRWTKKNKEKIVQSRLESTQTLISWLQRQAQAPLVFINASAVGYYGTSTTNPFSEDSISTSEDFLASTVKKWEECASLAATTGIRTVYARFGIVLDRFGGALPKMLLPYKLLIGGPLGHGNQWMSWIHLDDAVKLLILALKDNTISGPLNIVAPYPVTMDEFSDILSKVMRKSNIFRVPSFVLKLFLGEMSLLVIEGQKVIPKIANEKNFEYNYPTLIEALDQIIPRYS
jgi:uncharacterized protein (TIGR01777 family)